MRLTTVQMASKSSGPPGNLDHSGGASTHLRQPNARQGRPLIDCLLRCFARVASHVGALAPAVMAKDQKFSRPIPRRRQAPFAASLDGLERALQHNTSDVRVRTNVQCKLETLRSPSESSSLSPFVQHRTSMQARRAEQASGSNRNVSQLWRMCSQEFNEGHQFAQ